MAIIFGLLLGVALLVGIYICRSRCWVLPSPHPFCVPLPEEWPQSSPSCALPKLSVPIPHTQSQLFLGEIHP